MTEFPKRPAREGATVIEYGLIAALVALVVIAAARGVGTQRSGAYITLSGSLD